jgi:hypothetical protein
MRSVYLVLIGCFAACAREAPAESLPRDARCMHSSDCPKEHVCVTNRCLVPCDSDKLCVGCGDKNDCAGGAKQFCDGKRAAGAIQRPLVSREEFCADCHRQ